jgi:hypothetical protein
MSDYLLQEEPLIVQPTLAKAFGTDAAIVLQKIFWWTRFNQKQNKQTHFHEGFWWTYGTYQYWAENEFTWLNARNIKYIVRQLEDCGALISDNFNRAGFDKTKWYRVNVADMPAIVSNLISKNCPTTDKIVPSMDNLIPMLGQSDTHAEAASVLPIPDTITGTNAVEKQTNTANAVSPNGDILLVSQNAASPVHPAGYAEQVAAFVLAGLTVQQAVQAAQATLTNPVPTNPAPEHDPKPKRKRTAPAAQAATVPHIGKRDLALAMSDYYHDLPTRDGNLVYLPTAPKEVSAFAIRCQKAVNRVLDTLATIADVSTFEPPLDGLDLRFIVQYGYGQQHTSNAWYPEQVTPEAVIEWLPQRHRWRNRWFSNLEAEARRANPPIIPEDQQPSDEDWQAFQTALATLEANLIK